MSHFIINHADEIMKAVTFLLSSIVTLDHIAAASPALRGNSAGQVLLHAVAGAIQNVRTPQDPEPEATTDAPVTQAVQS